MEIYLKDLFYSHIYFKTDLHLATWEPTCICINKKIEEPSNRNCVLRGAKLHRLHWCISKSRIMSFSVTWCGGKEVRHSGISDDMPQKGYYFKQKYELKSWCTGEKRPGVIKSIGLPRERVIVSSNKSAFFVFQGYAQPSNCHWDGWESWQIASPGVLDLLGRQQVSSSHTDRQQNVPHVHLFSDWTGDHWKEEVSQFQELYIGVLSSRAQNCTVLIYNLLAIIVNYKI